MPGFARAIQGFFDHAGAGNANVDNNVRLAHAKVSASHEGNILRNVGKNHQLGAADAAAFGGGFGHLEDLLPHEGHSIHIDAAA